MKVTRQTRNETSAFTSQRSSPPACTWVTRQKGRGGQGGREEGREGEREEKGDGREEREESEGEREEGRKGERERRREREREAGWYNTRPASRLLPVRLCFQRPPFVYLWEWRHVAWLCRVLGNGGDPGLKATKYETQDKHGNSAHRVPWISGKTAS